MTVCICHSILFSGEIVQGLILTPLSTLGLHSGGEMPLPFPALQLLPLSFTAIHLTGTIKKKQKTEDVQEPETPHSKKAKIKAKTPHTVPKVKRVSEGGLWWLVGEASLSLEQGGLFGVLRGKLGPQCYLCFCSLLNHLNLV